MEDADLAFDNEHKSFIKPKFPLLNIKTVSQY